MITKAENFGVIYSVLHKLDGNLVALTPRALILNAVALREKNQRLAMTKEGANNGK
jgi:hypothetical protein